MKVLVVGNGGREHAITWKLLQSQSIEQVVCVPGNGGTASLERCQNLPLSINDFEGIAKFALENFISLVVVGPELPLAMGITDYLQSKGLLVFGPTRAGALIEASKAWAKALMQEASVETAQAAVFTEAAPAKAYVEAGKIPIVVKADGLAAGKGVTVAQSIAEAHSAIDAIFAGEFGNAGKFVLIEECLTGQEVSVLALTDGLTIRPLLPAQDHKRIGEGDTGENTGGMGVYAPAPLVTPALMQRIETEVLQKTLATLQKRGIDYRGVLYAGLMITPEGDFKVLEFNCRFGDPETQVILPLLETPLADLMLACARGRLSQLPPLTWKTGAACCVVAAAGGYPRAYQKGQIIEGIESAQALGASVFHAGTQLIEARGERQEARGERQEARGERQEARGERQEARGKRREARGKRREARGERQEARGRTQEDSLVPSPQPLAPSLVTDGGRVLGVTGTGENFESAIALAYAGIAQIKFDSMYYRRDIGHSVLSVKL